MLPEPLIIDCGKLPPHVTCELRTSHAVPQYLVSQLEVIADDSLIFWRSMDHGQLGIKLGPKHKVFQSIVARSALITHATPAKGLGWADLFIRFGQSETTARSQARILHGRFDDLAYGLVSTASWILSCGSERDGMGRRCVGFESVTGLPSTYLMCHKSLQRPSRRSASASPASASRRPTRASASNWRSQVYASKSWNHWRNSARSAGESFSIMASISRTVVMVYII